MIIFVTYKAFRRVITSHCLSLFICQVSVVKGIPQHHLGKCSFLVQHARKGDDLNVMSHSRQSVRSHLLPLAHLLPLPLNLHVFP